MNVNQMWAKIFEQIKKITGDVDFKNKGTLQKQIDDTSAQIPTKVSQLENDKGYKTTDTTYSAATTSAAGLMSAEDKTKLNGIATGAQVNSVTGVKGNKESSYRTGNVDLTAANIGALSTSGDSKDNTTTFTSADSTTATSWTDVAILASGEKHSSIFNKISTMIKNVRYLYNNVGKIKGIIETLDDCAATTQDGYAASAKALSELNGNTVHTSGNNTIVYNTETCATAYSDGAVTITGNVPCIGFHNPNREGAALYYEDGGFKFIKNDGRRYSVDMTFLDQINI